VTVPSGQIEVESSLSLSVTLKDASDNVLSGRLVAFQSSNPELARVSEQGLVTGVSAGGPVTLTAWSEGKSGSAQITVIPIPVTSVTVTPPASTIVAGTTAQLTASVLSAKGALTDRTVAWTSSNSAIASVSQSGLVSAVAVGGPITITATCEGKSAMATITVVAVPPAPVASVTVSPPSPTVIVGSTVQLTASTLDDKGNSLSGRTVAWSSSNSSIASVSNTGLVTAAAVGGPVTITATSEGKSGAASVTAIPVPTTPVASVTVSPSTASLIIGKTIQLTATVFDQAGNTLNGRTVTWTSGNDGLASVSPGGLVTGVAPGGPVTITAMSEGKSGSAAVSISVAPVASVTVNPPTASIIVGNSVQLTAKTLDADGVELSGRPVTWSSSNNNIASVSASGLVTGVNPGSSVTITATSEGRTGNSVVTVTAIPIASITVTPSTPTIIVGNTVQLTATALDGSGNTLTGRTFTWSSSNSSVASVNSSGLVTGAVVGGPVSISASAEGVIGSASVTVVPVPFNGIKTGISNVVAFLNQCPTTDPAYNQIRQDFAFLRDGVADATPVTCTEPYSTMPIAQLTDELVAAQTLRFIYYMSQGTAGRLPWTSLSLYDWMKSQVAGINFHSQQGLSACCDNIGGKLYIITSQQTASAREFYRDWPGLSGKLALLVHEARHVAGPGHVNGCPLFPLPSDPFGCDATYDLNNLGSYGVQYWLTSNWVSGYLNVGLGCSSTSVAQANASWTASEASGYVSRFVTNAPPSVSASSPYGGPCL
jgi:uncharacterized protein YjdB